MMGEDELIERIKSQFPSPSTLVGIGDDCAVIPIQNFDEVQLVTTDALVEGIHFLTSTISPHDLGYKTAQVNLSDIAAMGGVPLYAFLTLGLPKTDPTFLDPFLAGLKEGLGSVLLLGGDTVKSPTEIFINLTIMGKGKKSQVKTRDLAKEGDIICVDGYLGDSLGGLHVLQKGIGDFQPLVQAHQRPRAHLEEGQWLASQPSMHAMMDLSDGLSTDLTRLLKASHLGAEINLEKIPLSSDLQKLFADPIPYAIAGGEEYCLLFTVSKGELSQAMEAFEVRFGRPFYPIGIVVKESKDIVYLSNGKSTQIESLQIFKHF